MSDPVRPLSPSKRKNDHGQASSQIPPASTVRLVKDSDDVDIYSASPYPTRPEQILQPTASSSSSHGYIQPYGHDDDRSTAQRVSYSFQEPGSASTVTSSVDSFHDTLEGQRGGSVSEFSSIGHEGVSTSQIWLHEAKSSKTSVGQSPPLHETLVEHGEEEQGGEEERSVTSDVTLPPVPLTIKTVAQSSPDSTPSPPPTSRTRSLVSGASTPNVVPFTSSPNLVPVGSSSPNVVRSKFSDSSLYSANTFGTARRYWIERERSSQTPVASYVYSDVQDSHSPSDSIPSSPPTAVLRAFKSDDSISLPPQPTASYARPRTSSKGSTPSASASGSVPPVRYPKVRAPSSTVSWAESSNVSERPRSIPDRSGAQNPHLLASDSSDEDQFAIQGPLPPTHPVRYGKVKTSGAPSWDTSRQSVSAVPESEDECSDRLGGLRQFAPTNRPGSSHSSLSRLSSIRSLNRPGSSASAMLHILPAWARVYYKNEGLALHFSGLSLVEGSRPSTAAGEAEIVSPVPAEINRPRTRARQIVYPDPRDPRTHWRDGMVAKEIEPVTTNATSEADTRAWSPHLNRDKGVPPVHSNPWKPPSLDETAERFFSLRNLQIYCFVFGFIFPLAWLIASFLPLPERPVMLNQQPSSTGPDPENSPPGTPSTMEFARYESARWWRRVNRIMSPLGLVIIAVIVTLAVLGSRGAL
ncbi:hypothetical protein VTO42DRAFT_2178 [Malbranchea cinnamomea]